MGQGPAIGPGMGKTTAEGKKHIPLSVCERIFVTSALNLDSLLLP